MHQSVAQSQSLAAFFAKRRRKPFPQQERNLHQFMGNIPVTPTTKIFPKVLRYKWEAYCDTNRRRIAIQWEAYCDTNGRSTEVFPFPQGSGIPKVLKYILEAYCNTNSRCIAILFSVVVVACNASKRLCIGSSQSWLLQN